MKTPEELRSKAEEMAAEYDDDFLEGQPLESCPKCGRSYDDIDFDFQNCSKCGWDEENKKYEQPRKPTRDDYTNGDADIITGRWY